MAGPEDSEASGHEAVAAAVPDAGGLRVSHADREQVIGGLKTAFVQGRLTEEELGARAGQVYASRTYAELAEVTADLPDELTGRLGVRSRRDPWRATKIAWRVEYAVFLPGIVALLLMPGGPRTTVTEVVVLTSVVYLLFWFLGIGMMITSRPAKPALEDHEHLHASHAVARDQVARVLRAALAQGRLTEEEHDERLARKSDSRCLTDLDALIADLPAGLAAQPPRARDVRIGAGVSAAAASVFAGIVLSHPDNPLAFVLALLALATLIVAPVITAGLLADVRHQKRSGQQQRSRRQKRSKRRR
jgi:heme exporter protein D